MLMLSLYTNMAIALCDKSFVLALNVQLVSATVCINFSNVYFIYLENNECESFFIFSIDFTMLNYRLFANLYTWPNRRNRNKSWYFY